MKILIVSDTHRNEDNLINALEKEKNLDLLIHCGDVEGAEDEIEHYAGCNTVFVAGNNDFFSRLPREIELKLEEYQVWVTHGHNYYVNTNPEYIRKEARARRKDIVIYGHTHRPVIEKNQELIVINPGSLTYPRQEGRRPSYAVLEIQNKSIQRLEIVYL
ncbi:MAG: metallophosphoesterase [Lachnospiraceae bacterium]|nr:metallophosphoesterase [Lachnospiraceae bacterium]